jgi:hypothetical protein
VRSASLVKNQNGNIFPKSPASGTVVAVMTRMFSIDTLNALRAKKMKAGARAMQEIAVFRHRT